MHGEPAVTVSKLIDTTKPHAARMYDYFLGGKDHFAADRQTAEEGLRQWPTVRSAVRENRAFLGRVVRHLVAEAGIRQFLDIGTGLPSAGNVHEIAQHIAPESRIVYVDNDPIVLAHARALLTSGPHGATAYIDADLRRPGEILSHPALRETLDLSQPVALILVAVLHFIPDEDNPAALVSALLDALPSGSYLAASHVTPEHDPARVAGLARIYRASGVTGQIRTAEEFADLAFTGLEMVDPGVVMVSDWRPDDAGPRPLPAEVSLYCGLARKP